MKATAEKPGQFRQSRVNANHGLQQAPAKDASTVSPDTSAAEHNHPEANMLIKLQKAANSSQQVTRLAQLQDMIDSSPRMVAQRKQIEGIFDRAAQKQENTAGLPNSLKSGVGNPITTSPVIQYKRKRRGGKRRRQRAINQEQQQRLHMENARSKFLALGDEEGWKEIVDARHHHLGPSVYDDGLNAPPKEEQAEEEQAEEEQAEEEQAEEEPEDYAERGYLKSAMQARAHVGASIGSRIDADFLEQVHSIATSHRQADADYHAGYRDIGDEESNVPFYASEQYDSADPPMKALAQVNKGFTAVKTDNGTPDLANLPNFTGKEDNFLLHFLPHKKKTIKGEVNTILNRYYDSIGKLKTKDDKRKLIASTHRKLENLHPFLDANTRTNRLILHKLLVENNMSPVILDNPLDVHTKTDKQWADVLEQGGAQWQELRKERNRKDVV